MYKVFFHPRARESLNKLEPSIQERIKKKLQQLKKFPEEVGRHLKYSNFWRVRVGDYRVIYEIKDNEKKVIVLFIGHRKKVYDDFSKLF